MQHKARKPVSLLATSVLLVAAAFAAHKAQACGTQQDFLVRADPLLAAVRPADCATLLDEPAEFTWPPQSGGTTYAVALRFPDGHTETRDTRSNWLAWGPLPAGDYSWRVSARGAGQRRSDARIFRVEAPRAPQDVARESAAPRQAGVSASPAPTANLFRLEPSESWIPSAATPKRAARPSVGGFFGGFTQ